VTTALVMVILILTQTSAPGDAWPQWGGPHRNFAVDRAPIAHTWPSQGPRRLWQRPLGDGFSAIVGDTDTVYTLYRKGDRDVVVAIDAATGTTRWEYSFDSPSEDNCSLGQAGPAPRAAPLLSGDVLIAIGGGGRLHAVERTTGRAVWNRDLSEMAGGVRPCGYTNSPLAYKHLIVTTVGGPGRGVVAFDRRSGAVAWQSQDFRNGYSSPILIELAGRPQLIVFTYGEVAGLDPESGALAWQHPHPTDQGVNVTTPVWDNDGLLFISSSYGGGSRVLRLRREDDRTTVDEVWANTRVRIHFGNAVRIGQTVYASNGDTPTAPFAAIDLLTGEFRWRTRGIARASLIAVGERLLILDEDGQLVLATPGAEGLQVQSRTQVLEGTTWTVPTLIGPRLYIRNRQEIAALDLGVSTP
jgi:outer membrane protein assembly factor BamB